MELNFNSVETIPMLNASAAFKTDSGKVFKEDVDIVPTIIDKSLSYIPSTSSRVTRPSLVPSVSRNASPSAKTNNGSSIRTRL